MNKSPIIGIVGPQASGKTVAAEKLTDLGAARVRMGNIVWKEAEKRNEKVNEETVGKTANQMRQENSMGAIAKKSIQPINEKRKKTPVVVDGIRGIAEVEFFQKKFRNKFKLISIETPKKMRYERIKKRKREDDTNSYEEFLKKDKRESKWGLDKAIKSANYKVKNNGSLEELEKKIEEIFKEITNEN